MCNCRQNEFELLPELELSLNEHYNDHYNRRHYSRRHPMDRESYEYETPYVPPSVVPGGQPGMTGTFTPTACLTPAVMGIPAFLDPKLIGCINKIVPGVDTAYLLKKTLEANRGQMWVKLLNTDLATLLKKIYPKVQLTIELWQFVIIPRGNSSTVLVPLQNYLKSKGNNYTVSIFAPAINGKTLIEKLAKVSLDNLVSSAGPAPDQHSYYFHVYATFPDNIKNHFRQVEWTNIDQFLFNKYDLSPKQRLMITNVALDIVESYVSTSHRRYTGATIAGHTDIRGTESYNMELGKKRAVAVANALKTEISRIAPAYMIDVSKMNIKYDIVSFGETRPISTKPPINHALNRRVEITLQYTDIQVVPPPSDLGDIIKRCQKILKSKQTSLNNETFIRIQCLLATMQRPNVDDRYIGGNVAITDLKNHTGFPAQDEWRKVRFQLMVSTLFGQQIPDEAVFNNLMSIDYNIREAIQEIDRITSYYAGIPMAGAVATPQGVIAIMEWVKSRANDKNSIYYCYRP